MLSKDGYCSPFDEQADGYTRAEAICCIFLQKAKDAKRVYCTLVHSKVNCDGYKVRILRYFSGSSENCNIFT